MPTANLLARIVVVGRTCSELECRFALVRDGLVFDIEQPAHLPHALALLTA